MIHIEDYVSHERQTDNGKKTFSLWDTYVFADFVSYPSLWEGWGNQFLEALRACLPIFLFEYPVYKADIGPKGFQVVSLGAEIEEFDSVNMAKVSEELMNQAADEAIILLTNPAERKQVVENNFKLGQKYYSMDVLRSYLSKLISS